MTKLGDAKLLGGIGSILLFIPALGIVGFIMILIAGKFVSDELNDKSIFDNMLYAVVAGIVGVIAAAFIIFTGGVFGAVTFSVSAFAGILAGLAVAWIGFIVSAIFLKRAYDTMAVKLNIGTFKTAGMLYFLGAILVIILVGFLLLFIAAILQVVAFFSINEMMKGANAPMQPMATPGAPAAMKFCPSCGSQISASATFCPKCGAKQP